MKRVLFCALLALVGICCGAQVLTYEESPLSVELSAKSGKINGKLLLPKSDEPCPVALLIAGSGPTDMDGNSAIGNMENNSLKFLAEALAQNGIAVARFDKRGIASSKDALDDESGIRFDDYVNDVLAFVTVLEDMEKFKNITIIGHSEGSLVGMVAGLRHKNVDGFVSLAGAGRPAYEIVESQLADLGLPESTLKEVAEIDQKLKKGKMVKDVPSYLESLFRESVQPYMISWYKYNPQRVIKSLKIPALIIQGTTDIQVPVEDAQLLAAAQPKAQLLLIENMNHVLKACDSMDQQQQIMVYSNPTLPVNQTLVTTITSFIKGLE